MSNIKRSPCLTVGDLIEILSKYPKDMLVGAHGHFGEFRELRSPLDIGTSTSYIVPDGKSWRHMTKNQVMHVEIDWPDIGPEPD